MNNNEDEERTNFQRAADVVGWPDAAFEQTPNGEYKVRYTEWCWKLWQVRAAIAAEAAPAPNPEPFQQRVQPWMMACFGEMIAGDREERNHRFLEESLELVQSTGCTASEAHQLVDYVFGRPVGEPAQEVGGVMVTLAALCLANNLDMHADAETELARIWTKVEQIRAKQAAKPKHSPLPAHVVAPPTGVEEAFVAFCDREGYPSDGPFDSALRKAFTAGASLSQADASPLSLFARKLAYLRQRGHEVIGHILHKDGQYALFDSSCRWLTQPQYQRLMHEQNGSLFATASPAQAQTVADSEPSAREQKLTERVSWSTKQWYEHVGARENGQDEIVFGTVMALRAMMVQFREASLFAAAQRSFARRLADQRTPAELACWCQTCRPITMDDCRMVLCPTCGNKRCPHANDHRNACTGSNEPGQPGSAYPAWPAPTGAA